MEILIVFIIATVLFIIYKMSTTGFRDYTGKPTMRDDMLAIYEQSRNPQIRREMTPDGSDIIYTFPPVPGINDNPENWSKYRNYIQKLANNNEPNRALREMLECNEAWGQKVIPEVDMAQMRQWANEETSLSD
jgi:hypothetical protein